MDRHFLDLLQAPELEAGLRSCINVSLLSCDDLIRNSFGVREVACVRGISKLYR